MDATVLVDYDNACKVVKPERSAGDVAVNLEDFFQAFSIQVQRYLRGVESVAARFYGGWFDKRGALTDRGRWVSGELPNYRTRFNGVRFIPTMVTGLIALPEHNLIGTYRPDLSPSQKLVDGMLTVDSIELAKQDHTPILIASDDDDFVPVAIVTQMPAARKTRVYVFRREKAVGDGPNDELLERLSIQVTNAY